MGALEAGHLGLPNGPVLGYKAVEHFRVLLGLDESRLIQLQLHPESRAIRKTFKPFPCQL